MKTHVRGLRRRLLSTAVLTLSTALATAVVPMVPAAAQSFSGFSATGTIVDTAGKPIANATITMRSLDQGFTRTGVSNASGTYTIPELRNGDYEVTVTSDGYETYIETGVHLVAGAASNQFRLSPAGTATAGGSDIVVSGRRVATSDFDLTTTGQVINVADIATRLPVARDLTSVILLAPGTAGGSGAFGGLPSINGGAVSENAYFVNGLNITDFRKGLSPVTIPFEFYQTVEVKTGGYAAEFGRTTGGFTSATTKSGSNDFHGGVLVTWNPDKLRSYTKDTLSSDNNGGRSESISTIFQLSGPILKDHLFFYGLYQERSINTANAGRQFFGDPRTADVNDPSKFLGTTRGYYRTRSPFYAGKIDAIITDGQRLELTYFNTSGSAVYDRYGNTVAAANRYDYLTNTDGPFSARTDSDYGGQNYVGRYTGVFTKWLTVSAAYGRNEQSNRSQSFNSSNLNTPPVSDQRDPFNTKTLTQSGGSVTENVDVRKFYRGDVDIFVNLLGTHHLKGGYDREELSSLSRYIPDGNGIGYTIFRATADNVYGIATGADYVSQSTYRQEGSFVSRNDAFYIQDSWSAFGNRLNLSIGVRNDRFTNNNALGKTFYRSGNQWGPRIGFTFDPLGNQTDKIYGSFGRLFIPVASNTNIRLTGGETYYNRINLLGGIGADSIPILGAPVLFAGADACLDTKTLNCKVTGNGEPAAAEATVAQNLKPQSADEYILGYEKRFGSLWRAGAFFTYTKLNEVLEDAAIDRAVNNYCVAQKISGCSNIWGGFHQYVLINPGQPAAITLSDAINGESTARTVNFTAAELGYPTARRTYKAMTFEVHRAYDGVWSLDASYVYSKTIGNYEGGVKTDNGQSDTGLTTDFDQPGLTNGTYGYSPNDKRHVIKVAGSYTFFDTVNVGLKLQAYAPRRYGCIGLVPRAVDRYAYAYGAAGLYCQVNPDGSINNDPAVTRPTALIARGSVFRSDWLFINDLDISTKLHIGDAAVTLRATVFNLLNRQAKLNFNEYGTDSQGRASAYYRTVTQYQDGRNARLQMSFDF